MKFDVSQIKNGDVLVDFYTYYCEECGEELPENNPQYVQNEGQENEKHYCGDCAFKKGLINGEELKKDFYFWLQTNTFKNHYSPIIMENKVIFIRNSDYKRIKNEGLYCSRLKN